MRLEQWEQVKEKIKKNFTIEDEGIEDLMADTAEGAVRHGDAEFVIFESSLGRTKLQFQRKPKVEEKKYHYSHRQGESARVEYKHSDTEYTFQLKAYQWNESEDEWKEMDASNILAS